MSFLAGKRSGIFQMPLPKKRRLEAAATIIPSSCSGIFQMPHPKKRRLEAAATVRRTNPLTDALALPTLSALGVTPQNHTTA